MKEDLKIFFKYLFDFKEFGKLVKDGFKQLFELKSLAQLSLIISLLFIILILFKRVYSVFWSWVAVVVFFILSLYFRYSIVYKGGEHRKWYKDKKGIVSKKELLREEFDLRKGEKN
jgi:predicted membrane protein